MPKSPNITQPKRKRRWYQYSLRTFLLLATLLWVNGTQIAEADARKLQEALPNCQVYWSPPEGDNPSER